MKHNIAILTLAVLTSNVAITQRSWFIGAGATYTLPGKQTIHSYSNHGDVIYPDTVINFNADAIGRFGIYAEAGREWIWNSDERISGMEVGLHFKSLNAKEKINGTLLSYSDSSQILFEEISFDQTLNYGAFYPGVFMNVFNQYDLNKKLALRNNIGLNADFGVARGMSDGKPDLITGQVHYRFGVVYKLSERLRVMPSLETPLLTVYPWINGRSTLQFLDFRYRPIILSVRFMLADKAENKMDKGCLEIPDQRPTPHLWGDEMRKFRKAKGKGKQ